MEMNMELLQLEICHRRNVLLTPYLQERHKYGLRGHEGEHKVYTWVIRFGSQKWYVICDYWFAKGNRAQIDILIITAEVWYVLEVKNYDGHLTYKNDSCYLGDFKINDNPMRSMTIKLEKMQQIASELGQPVKVEGAMIFINEHNSLELDRSFPFEIISRNQLRHYLQTISDRPHQGLSANMRYKIDRLLEKYRVTSPFGPHDLGEGSFDKVRKGISCCECHSFKMEVTDRHVYCLDCKRSEPKHQAIIRSAKDLRILYYHQPKMVTTRNLFIFMKGHISRQTIHRIMKRKFEFKHEHGIWYYNLHPEECR